MFLKSCCWYSSIWCFIASFSFLPFSFSCCFLSRKIHFHRKIFSKTPLLIEICDLQLVTILWLKWFWLLQLLHHVNLPQMRVNGNKDPSSLDFLVHERSQSQTLARDTPVWERGCVKVLQVWVVWFISFVLLWLFKDYTDEVAQRWRTSSQYLKGAHKQGGGKTTFWTSWMGRQW